MALTTSFLFGGMNNADDPASIGRPDTTARVRDRAYTQCADIVNCDIDDNLVATRREGGTLLISAQITSAWSGDAGALLITGEHNHLHTYVGGMLTVLGNSPALQPDVEFCQVNDIVVFSDGITMGYIESNIPYIITAPSETTDILDLETWVKLTAPNNVEPNLEIDAFKLATLAGKCLEFYNGAIYLAIDNFVYCTKTFNIQSMDRRYSVVAGFKGNVTMIKAVSDGLFIGTTEGVYFLNGAGVKGSGPGVEGFTQKRVLPFGTIKGSDITAPANKVKLLKAEKLAAVWTTPDGIYAGADGGRVVNLSDQQMLIPAGDRAASMLRESDGAAHYVLSLSGGAIVVNLANATHSRYTNYDFHAFLEADGEICGVNATGVVALTGEADFDGAQIDTALVTPVADMDTSQLKRISDAYLQVRTAGSMKLAVAVDEVEIAVDLPFAAPNRGSAGPRQLRCKLPRGAKGTTWQLKVSNMDGCRFEAFNLRVAPIASNRSI